MSPWRRCGMAVILLIMGVGLLFYAHGSRKVSQRDLSFARHGPGAEIFAESWLLKGNYSNWVNLDGEKAIEEFRKAVALQPLYMDAWLALARGQAAMGLREEARETYGKVSGALEKVSTWKWQELLLAYETRDSDRFAASFNFILARLPHRVREASFLAVQYWGDWGSVIPHVQPEGRNAFLTQLMRVREGDAVLELWETMESSPDAVNDDLRLRVSHFLLHNGRPRHAEKVWKTWGGYGGTPVHDGLFEEEFLNRAFGWRVGRQPSGVVAGRSSEMPHKGTHCLHVHFRGSDNVNYHHVFQIVPVEPGASYKVEYAQKSRGITTDQGVFLEAYGHQCRGLTERGTTLLGTSPWSREQFQMQVPPECEAVVLRVRRRESLRFDNKIAGDYWLDDVRVVKVSNDPEA